MVPNQFGPPGKMVPRLFCLSKGQAVMIWKYGDQICGDHLSRGTLCPGGPNRLGTICPRGPELIRDHLSRGTNLLGTNYGGPNVRGPYAFGTKCVAASPQFRCPWLWVNDGGIQTYVLRTYMGFHHQASKVTISFEDQSVHPSLRFQRICNKSLSEPFDPSTMSEII